MESLNEHWLIIRSCNLKHLQYVNMKACKKIKKKKKKKKLSLLNLNRDTFRHFNIKII